jgi:replicative DNA helicase
MKHVKPALESEKTILGAILLDNGVVRDIADKLCPKDFDIYFHEELFESIIRLHKKHGVVDVPMLVDDLKLNSEHEGYVYELANSCPSVANVKSHADIVREKSVQRTLLEVANELKEQRNEKVKQIEHLASFLEECAAEIRATKITDIYLISLLVEITKGFAASIEEEKR